MDPQSHSQKEAPSALLQASHPNFSILLISSVEFSLRVLNHLTNSRRTFRFQIRRQNPRSRSNASTHPSLPSPLFLPSPSITNGNASKTLRSNKCIGAGASSDLTALSTTVDIVGAQVACRSLPPGIEPSVASNFPLPSSTRASLPCETASRCMRLFDACALTSRARFRDSISADSDVSSRIRSPKTSVTTDSTTAAITFPGTFNLLNCANWRAFIRFCIVPGRSSASANSVSLSLRNAHLSFE